MSSLILSKKLKGTKAISLIYEQQCTENCPIHETCEFFGKQDKCRPHAEYCASIYEAALDVCAETFNTKEGIRIGTMLIPMFSVLFRIKVEYAAIRRIVYATESGDMRVHPIVGEMRKQVAAIEKAWNNLGYKGPLPVDQQKRNVDYVDALMGE